MPHEGCITLKDCEEKRNCIRKEKHDTVNKTTGMIYLLDEKIDTVEERMTDNEKKNLKNHIILKNNWENTEKKVDWIIEEIKSFKKILWGLIITLLTSLLTLMGMLIKYIYHLISSNG